MNPILVFWTSRLFEALVNGFAPGLLVAAIVWAVTLYRARISAATRFVLLWLALALVVLIPLAALKTSSTRAISLHFSASETVATPITAIHSTPPVERPTQPATPAPALKHSPVIIPSVPQTTGFPAVSTSESYRASLSSPKFLSPHIAPEWSLAAAALWVAGALVFLFRLGWGFLRLTAWKKTCRPAEGRAAEFFQECVQKARPGRPVRLGFSPHLQTPVLAGLGSACILFPESLWEHLDETEREQVLLHELAHLRRWDDWTNLAERLLSALLFFHPVVRWLCARLRLEREIACDDWVLASGQPTRQYALCLTRLAELATTPPSHSPAPAFWFSRAQLSRRVGLLLDANRNGKTSPSTGIITVTALTLMLAALATLAFLPRSTFAAATPLAAPPIVPVSSPAPVTTNTPALPRLTNTTANPPYHLRPVIISPKLPVWISDWVTKMNEAYASALADKSLFTGYREGVEQTPSIDWPKLFSGYQTDPESAKLRDDLQAAEQKLILLDASSASHGSGEFRETKAARQVIQRQIEDKARDFVAEMFAKSQPSVARLGAIEKELNQVRAEGLGNATTPAIETRHHLEYLRLKTRADFANWLAWCEEFDELADAEVRRIMPGVLPDNELAALLNRLHSTEQQAAMVEASDPGPKSEAFRLARAAVQLLQKQVDDKVHGMAAAIKIRTKALQAGYESISNDLPRLDLQKELGASRGEETEVICRFEFDLVNTRAKLAINQALRRELTNTPPEALRWIMGAINQDPGEPKQNDEFVEASGKWHYAVEKLAMIKDSDPGPKSEEYREAESETKTAEHELDKRIDDYVTQFDRIVKELREREDAYTRGLQDLQAYCVKRESVSGPRYIEARCDLLKDEIKLLQSHLDRAFDATARLQIQTELADRNRELAALGAVAQKK